MNIAIRPDGSWWDVDEDGAEGDCDDVLRVEVPDEVAIEDVDEWALARVNWPIGRWAGEDARPDVSRVQGIDEVWSAKCGEATPTESSGRVPTISFELETGGSLELVLSDGSIVVVTTSEWGEVHFFESPSVGVKW